MPDNPPKTPRRRGGQPGNRNRLKHGRFSRRRLERRAKVRALLRKTRGLVCRLEMGTRARRALAAKSTLPLREGRKMQSIFPPTPRLRRVGRNCWSAVASAKADRGGERRLRLYPSPKFASLRSQISTLPQGEGSQRCANAARASPTCGIRLVPVAEFLRAEDLRSCGTRDIRRCRAAARCGPP